MLSSVTGITVTQNKGQLDHLLFRMVGVFTKAGVATKKNLVYSHILLPVYIPAFCIEVQV